MLLNAAPLGTVLTGVARYTRSLYQAVEDQNLADVSYLFRGRVHADMPAQANADVSRFFPGPIRHLAREARLRAVQRRLDEAMRKNIVDVYHETESFPLVRDSAVPTVITIYDLSLISHKHCHPLDRVRHFERHFYKRIALVDHIITISEFIRREVIETLQIPADKITAIPLGVTATFSRRHEGEVISHLQNKGLPDRYVLSVGTQEPRKNLVGLIKALSRAKKDSVLICVGSTGWMNQEIDREVQRLDLEDRVIRLGHLPDEELALLYSGAQVMVYPSLYEGFGLPILEAMACGCPVICGDRGAMAEVAGDAACLVDPEDTAALTEALDLVLTDETLRQTLITKGHERSASFSWEQTAKQTLAVFDRVCSARG